jgi:membrane-bound lytic murein transglycosylase D
MGMGRHLFWRQTLCGFNREGLTFFILLFILFFFISSLKTHGNPLPPRITPLVSPASLSSPIGTVYYEKPLSIRQGLKGPVLHTIEISTHPLLSTCLNEFSQPREREWIRVSLDRGWIYRDFIISKIRSYGLPEELSFLPLIESEYRVEAVSPSGATGLWQFMTNSIYPFDIRINEWLDERKDFWKSTEGSLRKLKYNYENLGDWLLAIAAYNCGLGCVQRAIRRTGIEDFWELAEGNHLPAQTIRYVPKFLAVSHIASYRGRYGLGLTWDQPFKWSRISPKLPVDLRILAGKSEIPYRILVESNAELQHAITPPGDDSYFLKVPAEYSDVLERTLRDLGGDLINVSVHTITKGDTVFALSRHFNIPVALILQYNPGIKVNLLQIGQKLLIPAVR